MTYDTKTEMRLFRAMCGQWLTVLTDAARHVVADLPRSAAADPLAALSPRKRDAHNPRAEHDHSVRLIGRRALGRFLAVRIATLIGGNRLFATLGLPVPAAEIDITTLFDIGRRLRLASFADIHPCDLPAVSAALAQTGVWQSIAALPDNIFTTTIIAAVPQEIAGWSGDPLRKRAGIFHTPAPVARRLAELTLREPGATLDPACGGGALLLAAFDVFTARGLAPSDALACLYGLDLDPVAVDMTRLALAHHAAPLTPAHLAQLWARIRPGHALISACDIITPDPVHVAKFRATRQTLLATDDDRAAFDLLAIFETQEAALRPVYAQHFANLPLNAADDWQALAAAHPFNWSFSFAEIVSEAGFAAVLANPPFVGFNDYSGVEKVLYARSFPQVYNLKSDLLYYFVARGVGLLRAGGRLGYITSRFWRSATYAAKLRAFLNAHMISEAWEDLDPATFDGAQVAAGLLVAQKKTDVLPVAVLPTPRRTDTERLIARIAAAAVPLSEIAECVTGVQTGYDAAFMLSPDAARRLPPELVRPAIKSSDIAPFVLTDAARAMLYLDKSLLRDVGLDDADAVWARWPELAAHLQPFRVRLAARRRYTDGFPDYLPQWPRRRALFEAAPKLVTPYKAPFNTFALDPRGYFFSTDVIAVVPRPAYATADYLYALLAVLNSRVATFYFRSYAKQVGGGQYDYYANPVKRLPVPRNPDPTLWAALTEIGRRGTLDDAAERLVCDCFGLDAATLPYILHL